MRGSSARRLRPDPFQHRRALNGQLTGGVELARASNEHVSAVRRNPGDCLGLATILRRRGLSARWPGDRQGGGRPARNLDGRSTGLAQGAGVEWNEAPTAVAAIHPRPATPSGNRLCVRVWHLRHLGHSKTGAQPGAPIDQDHPSVPVPSATQVHGRTGFLGQSATSRSRASMVGGRGATTRSRRTWPPSTAPSYWRNRPAQP